MASGSILKDPAEEDEVSCDVCNETKLKALKSCLVCLISYCATHLEPHQRLGPLKRHKLIDPVKNLEEDYVCKKHDRPLEMCSKAEHVCQYAVDVTLDPGTAHRKLILSEDGKQVYDGGIEQNLPDNRERFLHVPCVLGKQSFSSGRFYYEVQVKGKTWWSLGVARESILRKFPILVNTGFGCWTMMFMHGLGYSADSNPDDLLPVKEEVQKVGVFVDYEEGLVSFYDVEARVHLYSFTGCTFTEKIYPFFCPCFSDGTNNAPLIISPVNHTEIRQTVF